MEVLFPGLAKCLKPLRQTKKLTQKQMAQLLDYTEQHYQKIEYGQVNIPISTLVFLADFFGVSTDYLLGHETKKAGE